MEGSVKDKSFGKKRYQPRPKGQSLEGWVNSVNPELLEDSKDAGYRLAGKQFVKLTRDPLVAFLSKHISPDNPDSVSAKVRSFLDTEMGEAVVASLLSLGLACAPKSMGQYTAPLARELRVKAMTDVGDTVADVLMAPLRKVIADYIAPEEKEPLGLPLEAVGRARVDVEVEVPQAVRAKG